MTVTTSKELSSVFDPEKLAKAQQKNPFVKISDAVYEIIEEGILTSELKPGTKLKINKIADSLHVSGTPVREAVERLMANGLVVESVGAGGKYKNYYVFDIDDDDIGELFLARKSIESTAAFLCAQKNWKVDIQALEKSVTNFKAAIKDYINGNTVRLATQYDREFHTMIVDYSRNRYLIEMYRTLDKKLNYLSIRTCEFLAAAPEREALASLYTQHAAVVYAINMGFPLIARTSMDDHIDFCATNCLSNRYISETLS